MLLTSPILKIRARMELLIYKKVNNMFISRLPAFSLSLRLMTGLTLVSALISACSGSPVIPSEGLPKEYFNQPSSSPASGQTVFGSATSKRTLNLDALPSNSGILATGGSRSGTGPNATSGSAPMAVPSAAPTSAPGTSDISASVGYGSNYGYGYGTPYMPFSSGGDFNSYVPVQAEENIFAGSSSQDLLEVYAQTIQPLLKEWDAKARLVENRGNTSASSAANPSYEYVYLPGGNDSQPVQLQPSWTFRFVSTPRKETLTVYVMHKETRAYRVSWSEPNLDLSKVKVSVPQAQDLARKAIADTNAKPGYSVFPVDGQYLGGASKILYEVPANLNWSVSLGQQGQKLVYYLSFNYREDILKPGSAAIVATPQPSGSPAFIINQVSESPSPVPSPSSTPTSSATPDLSASPTPTPTPTPFGTALPTATPYASPSGSSRPYPDCLPDYARYAYINASITIDAISGKILELNRPVRYDNGTYYSPECHAPGASPPNTPTPYPYGGVYPTAYPSATATSDI